ncbi:hypothetical protein VP1G_07389 [Cytospora mali]|uniref:Uncharacterized protein n=1 Tax=Cytospora mali TaxID=578113 RepID=A0A194V8K3_CYTMA|nr:hypothetical protein VP1G_07389 [Valsa mali var. pyri (nom. inval.)]
MPPTTRHRSRSSVDHIFDLVGDLDEDQLSNLLHELNSSTETNVPVSQGVEYFEEQRRARGAAKVLRPTPSFLNQPHEPVDWPKHKPRTTEPISPPLTASPPLSPPLSPPKQHPHNNNSSPRSPRRSVTAPLLSMEKTTSRVTVEIESVPLERPISPPRHDEDDLHDLQSSGFASFSFDGPDAVPATPQRRTKGEDSEHSPRQQQQQQQQPRQQPDFSRISTMPLSSFHSAEDTLHSLPRPRTSTGDAATTANAFKPRSFRRISRPVFLSPANIPAPDDLAQRLSQYLFEDPSPPFPPLSSALASPVVRPAEPGPESSLEAMLKEPAAPPTRMVYGRVEKEVPSVGIFEVLNEG